MVFYTADAGIEVGRQMLNSLKTANPAAWTGCCRNRVRLQDLNGNPVTVSTLNQVVDATANRQVGLARSRFRSATTMTWTAICWWTRTTH